MLPQGRCYPGEATVMHQLIAEFRTLSSLLREVCDGINSGRMAWPEAEARLREACTLLAATQGRAEELITAQISAVPPASATQSSTPAGL